MDFVDRELKCFECGSIFLFSADEQQFFRDKGFTHHPKRCKRCKAGRDGGTSRAIEARVICGDCGRETTVPFRPTGKRPVLCSVCFQKQPTWPKREISTGSSLVKPASASPPTE
jgi:CxxC-x17-CxxC domain-containing protein